MLFCYFDNKREIVVPKTYNYLEKVLQTNEEKAKDAEEKSTEWFFSSV